MEQQPDSAVAVSSVGTGSSSAATQSPFVQPVAEPTQTALDKVSFDFNCGARVLNTSERSLHCKLIDMDSNNVLYDAPLKAGMQCAKKFYIRYKLTIYDGVTHETLFDHEMNLKDRHVFVHMPYEGAIGDSIAWFSTVERFQQQHQCRLHVLMPPRIQELVQSQYPDICFETPESARNLRPYASYYLGLYFKGDTDWQPYDFRLLGLAETAAQILGLDNTDDIPPRCTFGKRTIRKPYVCIAAQASAQAKHWCNPCGWMTVVSYLKECGYRVLCIDKDPVVGVGDVWHHIPYGCEDFTGNRPLQERLDMMHYADFFIGLPSGLSWLAWMSGTPVVMISGFSMPYGEFYTPYRVQTRHTCHGCWNDTRYEFDHSDFMWCPKYKGTDRAYECTKAISPEMVINTIKNIPGVLPHP